MENRIYAAMWGREFLFIWHYQVGGLPYLKTGNALGKRRAMKKALEVYRGR
jgi:hypothetical protein